MALHAARVIRQRHKADSDHIESDISPEQRKNLEDAFEAADKNGDGVLSADEYYEIFQTHGLTIGRDLCSFCYVLNGINFVCQKFLSYEILIFQYIKRKSIGFACVCTFFICVLCSNNQNRMYSVLT